MQQIDPTIFKAYDIRGVYPDQLNEDVTYRIARAFAQELKPSLTIVGRDMRLSGPALVEPVTHGLIDQGSDVIYVGLSSTPMFYYSVNVLNADAGMMITASHNPQEYNGFKMTGPEAIPSIAFVDNARLHELANAGSFQRPTCKGHILSRACTLDDYVQKVLELAGVGDFGDLKIVADASNGMEGMILPSLFKGKNCTVYPLYWELDGRFPNHEADPLKEETLNDLKSKVLETDADIGVMFDGDGDRVGFVDETGSHVPGDIITALVARQMLREQPGAKIVYEVRSSWAVKEEIQKAGGEPIIYKAGHGLIKKYMREIGAYFGGELSGHYFFSNFYLTDNAELALLKIIQLLVDEGKHFSELTRPIMRYHHSPEYNSQVRDMGAKLAEVKDRYSDGRTMEIEGVTVEYDDWWFNLRPSQTEPLLRLNVEATTKEKMDAKVKELLDIIRE